MIALYSLISEERLQDVLRTLQAFTGLPIRLLDSNGMTLCRFGEDAKYCRLLKRYVFSDETCTGTLLKAAIYAQSLGEAYVFSCHANLNHIAFPLVDRDVLLGSILVGPFLMDQPDSTILTTFAERHPLSPDLLLDLYDELPEFPVLPPNRVNHLKKLLELLLLPLLPGERQKMEENQKRLSQQSKINEAIQIYKEQRPASTGVFLYEKEQSLLLKARTGDIAGAKALLNDLLGYVFFYEGGSVEAVRAHAIELTTLLSRIAMESGAKVDYIYGLNNQYLTLMSGEKSMEELCYLLQEMVESFMEAMFSSQEHMDRHIREAIAYAAEHYPEKLTTADVAAAVGLSEGHFSRLFQKSAGMTFREHLNCVRVEQSKHLLRATDYPLSEIAVSVGFPDQSYFCKIFKRITGMTPGQYR